MEMILNEEDNAELTLEPTLYVYETVQLDIVPHNLEQNEEMQEYFIDLFHGKYIFMLYFLYFKLWNFRWYIKFSFVKEVNVYLIKSIYILLLFMLKSTIQWMLLTILVSYLPVVFATVC